MFGPNLEDRERWRQGAVGWALVLGLLLVLGSGIAGFTLATSSVHTATASRNPNTGAIRDMGTAPEALVAFGGVILGLLLIGGALVYGVVSSGAESRGARREVPHAKVVARYVLSPDGLLHTDPNDIEMVERPKYYVRLAFPGQGSLELQTSPETFWYAGEGMTGTAEVQGRWLGRFLPYVGAGTGHLAGPP